MSRSDRGVRPRKRPREAGEGGPSGSKLPPSHPSVTFGASSPRRGAFYCCANLKAPFTQGGLRPSKKCSVGANSVRPCSLAAAQDCTGRRGRRPLRPTAKPPLCKGRWHGVSRDGGIGARARVDRYMGKVTIPHRLSADRSRGRAPLSLRDISPHCGESPFTQGGL